MDEKTMDEMALDLMSPLCRWLGLKRILMAMAKIGMGWSREAGETGGYWTAKHNAELLEDVAEKIRE